MSRFTLPRDIYYGKDSLETLKTLKGKKAVIVLGGGSMKRFGFVDKAVAYLKEAGIETKLFENVEPDPSVETVMKGAQMMREYEPDWIISMGGGSPIDAAKAMWAFYEHPDTTFEDLIVPFNFPKLRTKAHFCAIPTTSGTATEVTAFSVITDYSKGIKYPLADFEITPDVAILDPVLVASLPAKQVAYTGMDALTHAIEGYTTKGAWEMSDMLHLKAIELISKNLRDAVAEAKSGVPGSGREGMALAQYIAGMGFSNVGLGVDHSMAHTLSAHFDTPHGVACAMLLPIAMEFNKPVVTERLAKVAVAMGVDTAGMSTDEAADAAIAAVKQLSVDVQIPTVCEAITEDELDTLTKDAMADACFPGNPREATYDDVMGMFRQIMK